MIEPIVVSYSELDAFRQCPHKADLAYKQRWVAEQVGPALTKGRHWHALMEIHYRAIQADTTDHARRQAIVDYLADVAGDDMEVADLLAWMYDSYEDRWGLDPDWEILAVEDQRLIRLPTTTGRASRYWLRMRADLLVYEKTMRKTWLIDHKTGRNLPTDRELDIDDQFGLYTWGLRTLGVGVFGAICSTARTYRHLDERPLDERFDRSRLYRTDRELETIAREAFMTARTHHTVYRSGEAPRAPDSDRCRWRCPYTEPCLMGRKSGNEAERLFLQSSGFMQLTEQEQLAERGYPTPALQPPREDHATHSRTIS